MKIYCIIECFWDYSRHYNPSNVYCFSTEEKRDETLKKFEQGGGYKRGDIIYFTDETELDKTD